MDPWSRLGLIAVISACVWSSARPVFACTCPQMPQVVGDGGNMPENARALFFWTPDLLTSYQADVTVRNADGARDCASRVEPVGPEDLHTLHLTCELHEGDEVEVRFLRDAKVLSRSQLAVTAPAKLPKSWAALSERPARRFETETDTGTRCSTKSQVFGLQIPIRWKADSLAWSDISVLSASVGKTPYRRPLSSTCDRGFDTAATDTLEIFSRGPGHNRLVRKKVGLSMFVPGRRAQVASAITLNVPAEFEHRPVSSYAAAQDGTLAADLSAIDTSRSLAQVYKRIETCSAKGSLSVELAVAGANGNVVDVSVEGSKIQLPKPVSAKQHGASHSPALNGPATPSPCR